MQKKATLIRTNFFQIKKMGNLGVILNQPNFQSAIMVNKRNSNIRRIPVGSNMNTYQLIREKKRINQNCWQMLLRMGVCAQQELISDICFLISISSPMLKTFPQQANFTTPNQSTHCQLSTQTCRISEYTCLCSKAYKSYAAVYTHIKIKHKDSLKFHIENIKRPQNSKGEKGRPRKCPAYQTSEKHRKMEVLQNGNMDLWEKIKAKTTKSPLLDIYEEYDEQEIKKNYREIVNMYGLPVRSILDDAEQGDTNFKQFYVGFCKHTSYEISAKILWTLNNSGGSKQANPLDAMLEPENRKKTVRQIWFNIVGVEEFLLGVYEKWKNC